LGLLWTMFVGLIAGAIAKAVMPGAQRMGILLTICLGVAGSIVVTYLGHMVGWYKEGEGARFIGSTLGALLVLFVYGQIVKRKS
jgi:uncharacterized membrane protein YeaQ/YmgE (transglycosylase-associated protein family)